MAPGSGVFSGQLATRLEAGASGIRQSFHCAPLPHPLLQRSTCSTPSFPDHPLTTTELRGWSGNVGVHNEKEWVGEG